MKYKFLIKSLKGSTINTFLKVRKKVSQKSNKKFIALDMIYCSIKYQAAFFDYLEFEFYNLNNKQRKTFLTNGKNNEIVKIFNDKNYWHILDNKKEFNDYFKKYLNRDYLSPNSSKDEFNNFIKNKDKIILKPVDGIGGKGIEIKKTSEIDYEYCKKYLLEEVIIQNKKLNKIYDKSVNSLRMFTFFDGKNSYLLQSIIKFGNNGFVDNFSSGGMYAFVDDLGKVITPAIDQNDNIYISHPYSKEKILGFTVPLFEEAKKTVLNASKELNNIKYIGWDVAIKDDGICIIEGNSYPGVFQIKPSFSSDKTGILPKYEQIMKLKL
jgi:hypothetical protein